MRKIEAAIDLGMEKGVLSSLLNKVRFYEDALKMLKDKNVFTSQDHQRIFKQTLSVYEKEGDIKIFLIASYLKGVDQSKDWFAIIRDIQTSEAFPFNLTSKCLYLIEISTRRALYQANSLFLQKSINLDEDVFETIADQTKSIQSILENLSSSHEESFEDSVKKWVEEKRAIVNGEVAPGLTTGLWTLDEILLGLRSQQLIVIAGRPGAGKTTLGLQIALHLAQQTIPVGFLSLEMSKGHLIGRMFSYIGQINTRSIIRPREEDLAQIDYRSADISQLPILVHDKAGMLIDEIEVIAQEWKRTKGIRALFIDYLQLIQGDKHLNKVDRVGDASTRLKNLAKRLDIPVIALAQLGRDIEKRGAGAFPIKSDLKESGQIEQDADVIIMLKDPSDAEIKQGYRNEGDLEIHVRKNRDGAETPNDQPLTVHYLKKFNRIIDY